MLCYLLYFSLTSITPGIRRKGVSATSSYPAHYRRLVMIISDVDYEALG